MSKATKRERQKENRERAREERQRLLKRDRRMKSVRNLAFLLAPVALIAIIVSATGGDDTKKTAAGTGCSSSTGSTSSTTTPTRTFSAAPPMTIDQNATYTANVCTSEGAITLSLDAKAAPVAIG